MKDFKVYFLLAISSFMYSTTIFAGTSAFTVKQVVCQKNSSPETYAPNSFDNILNVGKIVESNTSDLTTRGCSKVASGFSCSSIVSKIEWVPGFNPCEFDDYLVYTFEKL